MKSIAAIFSMLILSSCAITSKKAIGIYSSHPSFEINATLQLKADGTFIYINGLRYPRTLAEGIWLIDEKYLLLTSYPVDKDPRVTFKKSTQNSFTLKITDDQNIPLPGAIVDVYKEGKSSRINTDRSGHANLNYQPIDSIVVGALGFNNVAFVPQLNTNSVDVKLGYYDHIILKNERWKISGNKLYSPEYEKDGKRYVFRKQKSKELSSN